ncbi:hypothetical protein SEA_JEFE_88 [Microbacterium phage Jefe]|uniref:Uncharacterized protein n=2 Tax=Quhwahvirus TaxID=2733202 RepID=A0A2U8UPR6_9CAUD|nr:hypothetical protein HOT30_gp88 [Microbacterium phage Paschalis]YP_010751559.1 hypothetical protein QDA06_gp87 [Microbacterium phage Shotgun]AWN05580.1 hypothetical protein SEA_PASCHALIS_87 [Microbacterium phage Paschalis]QYW07543.1 hypothetical protein SEA_SHOTGUN_87 [Microbacterium phage Shotgun]WBF79236.1 hypothetical protein SEA_JEFE_88 [Microbacterium phage Jefe]
MSEHTVVKRTQDELVAELRSRFGDNPQDWAFICPQCGDIARSADFKAALEASGRDGYGSDHLGQICVGRLLGALDKSPDPYTGRGCDWAAFGLFSGPEFVILPDGRERPCFAIAPAPEGATA